MRTKDFEDLYNLEESLWWFTGMREITQALLDRYCPPTQDRTVLDAGSGTGDMIARLTRYAGNGTVFGIDIDSDALAFCRKRNIDTLTQASATSLPFVNEIFDLVTSFDVLVQLQGKESDLDAIDEIYRVLRPGGVAFFRVAAYRWMRSGHDEALETFRRYSLDNIRQSVKASGFEILRETYANCLLLPVAAIHRLILKPLGLTQSGSDVKALPTSLSWLNKILTKVLSIEASILKHPRTKLPFGLSAICIVRKPLS